MNIYRVLIFLTASASAMPTWAEVWKCVDADGNTRYENDAAKAKGCKALNLDPFPEQRAKQAKDFQLELKERQKETDRIIAQMRSEHNARQRARLGMSQQEASKAGWGRPDKVTRVRNTSGTVETWSYRYPNKVYEYHFNNGLLTTIVD